MRVAAETIVTCTTCGNVDTPIPARSAATSGATSILVVVEDVSDLWALERAQAINARYHVLGGTLRRWTASVRRTSTSTGWWPASRRARSPR